MATCSLLEISSADSVAGNLTLPEAEAQVVKQSCQYRVAISKHVLAIGFVRNVATCNLPGMSSVVFVVSQRVEVEAVVAVMIRSIFVVAVAEAVC